MSRTDHHRPYWVRNRDHLEDTTETHGHYSPWHPPVECDLHLWEAAKGDRNSWHFNCYRWLDHMSRYSPKHVPKWYIDHTWYNPERVRARSRLREATKEYNGSGDLDDYDYPNFQHRHRSSWYWD